VEIHCLQGERKMAVDNKTIGRFHLDGIPPAPRGVPQIEVSFDIDASGILHVSAKDLGTGKEQKITITASSGLSKEEVEKMRRDAEAHAAEDQRKREEVETRNQADSLVYQTEKFLKENADKVDAAKKGEVERAIGDLKSALAETTPDPTRLKSGMESVNTAMQALSQELYSKARASGASQQAGGGEAPPSGGEGPAASKDGDVIDADFEMVDEESKKKKK
jgi:molecular chaperone DnaK